MLMLLCTNALTCRFDFLSTDLLADQKGLARDQVQSWTPYAGGAPFNVATALSKLGAKTAFVSALGKDERGQGLVDILKGIMVN